MGDGGKTNVTQHLHRLAACILGEVKRHRLSESAQIRDAEHGFAEAVSLVKFAKVSKYLAIRWIEKRKRTAAEHLEEFSQRNHIARPVQEARLIA